MQGFIVLHRKMLEWEWFTDINTSHVFLYCLLKANHENKNWRGNNIDRGSFITSLEHISKDTGLSIQQVRTALNKLKSTGELTSKSTSSYSIISIKNYNLYQDYNKQDNKQITNEQQTNNKRVTTTNNDNNDNNVVVEEEKKENCFYGEYNNVYLTFENYSKLKAMILNDTALNEIINALSNAIETGSGKYKSYDSEFPNAHFVHLKNFWKYRSNTGIKKTAISTATKENKTTGGYNFGF